MAANIDLGDGYGRSKRAALTYTGLLALLCLVTPTVAAKISWSGLDISLTAAKVLAWAAALYYVIGFYLEWTNALRNNSHLVRQDDSRSIRETLTRLQNRFSEMLDGIIEKQAAFDTAAKAATERVEKLELSEPLFRTIAEQAAAKPMPSQIRILTADDQDAIRNANVARAAGENFMGLKLMLDKAVSDFNSSSAALMSAIKQAFGPLERLSADFRRLSKIFNREQRILFYVYDLGATLFFFGGTTIFAILGGICRFTACSTTGVFIA